MGRFGAHTTAIEIANAAANASVPADVLFSWSRKNCPGMGRSCAQSPGACWHRRRRDWQDTDWGELVLPSGIEPPTYALPRRCSTPELRQRRTVRSEGAHCRRPRPPSQRSPALTARRVSEDLIVRKISRPGPPSARNPQKKGRRKSAAQASHLNYLGVSVGSVGRTEVPPRLPPR
jgi:hypothetical protein